MRDAVGAGLFASLAGWALVSGWQTGRDASATAALVLAVGAAAFSARSLTRRWPMAVPGGLAFAVVVIAALAWPGTIGGLDQAVGGAVGSSATYVIGVSAACLALVRAERSPAQAMFGALAGALSVLPWLAGFRAASVSVMLVVVTTAIVLWKPPSARSRWWVLGSAALASVTLVATVLVAVLAGTAAGGDVVARSRVGLWADALGLARDAPLVGVGPGGFGAASQVAAAQGTETAHHEVLQLSAEIGIVGGVLLVAIIAWAFVWLDGGTARRGAVVAAVTLAALVAQTTVDATWHTAGVPVALAALVGSGATAASLERR
jgi:O-antigen ligase